MTDLGKNDMSQASDGYHTFAELYEHRTLLLALAMEALDQVSVRDGLRRDCWKSRLHHDGSQIDSYFIAGINLSTGQITYHCKNEYWILFDVPELPRAPEWDGHTPRDVLWRIRQWLTP